MVKWLRFFILALGIIGICSWTAHSEAADSEKYSAIEAAYLRATASGGANYFVAVEVTSQGSLVNVDVQDAEIADVLKEIEKGSGVKITVDDALKGKTITAKFENKDMEGALREILRGYIYTLNYSQDPSHINNVVLSNVKVSGDIIGAKPLKGYLTKFEIQYGTGKGEVGAFAGPEGSSDGPCSYAVDDKDTIYILDRLNNRLQVYSTAGTYLSTITLRTNLSSVVNGVHSITHVPIDIVTDSSGFIYVYDSEDNIYQYDVKGNIISSIAVDKNGWSGRSGPMTIVNDKLFIGVDICRRGFCGNAIIGKLGSDKKIINPTMEEASKPWAERKYQSGKTIKGRKFVEGYNTDLDIVGGNGKLDKTLSVPYKGVLTVETLGEDKHGNFYFKIRTDNNEDRLYNIDAFSPNGDYLGTAQIPGGTYYVYPAIKDFIVSRNGNIYYYIPEEDSLKIFVFLNQSNQ